MVQVCKPSWFFITLASPLVSILVTLVLSYSLLPIVYFFVSLDPKKNIHQGDAYFQGCVFHSFKTKSWEVSSIQIHAWQGFSLVPLFELHDKRHFMQFYLNFKMPVLKEIVPDNKCSNLVTLINYLQGGLNPFNCFRI